MVNTKRNQSRKVSRKTDQVPGTNRRELITDEIKSLLNFIRDNGFIPQFEIAAGHSKFQTITVGNIYLKPTDGSDQFHCVCCVQPYERREEAFRGIQSVPIGWCDSCRELLRSLPYGKVIEMYSSARIGKKKLIERNVRRINKLVKQEYKLNGTPFQG